MDEPPAASGAHGMTRQKVLAAMQMLRTDDNLGAAALVALGALFLLLSFTFYPVYLVPVLAAAAGAVAYKHAPLGTIFGLFIAFPAIAYQAPVLAWVFTLVLALALFEAFEHWSTISFLEIAILAPFAPFPFSLLSGFLFLLLAIAALRFGSSHSVIISICAVFLVLLLSTIWLQQPSISFLTISNDYISLYGPAMPELENNGKPVMDLSEVASGAVSSMSSMIDFSRSIMPVSDALKKIGDNLLRLMLTDFAIIQLIAWSAALFICAFLPGHISHRYKQSVASLSLFLIPISNIALAPAFSNPPEPLGFVYCAASVGAILFMEHFGISLSREKIVERHKRQKAFGKFGLQDLGDSTDVKSLADVGGYEDVKAELREAIIAPLTRKDISYTYGLKPPGGILLFGPPGTGKTHLMKALAKEMDLGFYYVKCSDLLSEWYGESEKNVAEVFAIARKKAPCVLFFDEIDSIGKKRDAYTSDDVAPRIMSVMLEEMDGFKDSKKQVIVIGATNMPDQLDSALLRPGRLDKIIYMHLPDIEARKAIFQVHLGKVPTEATIDFGRLAAITERYSGADIKNICTEASRLAAREAMAENRVVQITQSHIASMIRRMKPSVSLDQIDSFERFRMDYERRSGADEKKPEEKGVRWSDVAGLVDVRQILLEAIELPLLHEDLMKEMDVKPSKGLLLFGPPGCGKTMIVKAAANELNANFLTISGSELMKGKDKSPASYVREVFNRARESTPALVFIDEIEALAPNRDEYRGGILTELLQELDGVKELKNVMLVGATNKPSALDPAILRPGRFDKILYIPPPDEPARRQIFTNNLAKFLKDMDIAKLAGSTEGFSGADISSACQEAKMGMVRSKLKGKAAELSTKGMLELISLRKPSITQKDLREYSSFMQEYGERK